MTLEHHRDLAHEFPELKARIHELKLASPEFRRLYVEYQTVDKEIYRIEQDIETTSDAYAEELKFRRVWLKDRLYGLLTGRIEAAVDSEGHLARGKFPNPVRAGTVRRDWEAHGYSCRERKDPPGHERLDVACERDGLLTVVEGRLEVALGAAVWSLGPGDELFVPHGVTHAVRNTFEGETRWLEGVVRGPRRGPAS